MRFLPWRIAAAILWLSGSLSCSSGADEAEFEQAALAAQADQLAASLDGPTDQGPGVTVQLAFGAAADLDLYVTDPLLDTVYFARHETRTGGRISADVRCDTTGPRIEEVRFDEPWAGLYRVGVDYPQRCDGAPAPAPAAYAVTAHVDGETYQATGSVALEQFQIVVLEFELLEVMTNDQGAQID
jgi:hypothetical protein